MLSARFLRSWWRSPVNLVVQAAQYLFFAFLIGAGNSACLSASACNAVTALRHGANTSCQLQRVANLCLSVSERIWDSCVVLLMREVAMQCACRLVDRISMCLSAE